MRYFVVITSKDIIFIYFFPDLYETFDISIMPQDLNSVDILLYLFKFQIIIL